MKRSGWAALALDGEASFELEGRGAWSRGRAGRAVDRALRACGRGRRGRRRRGGLANPTTSLLDLRARQYDETSGRFLGLDPKPAGPATPYESAYDYAGQDPINGYDLSGTNTTWPVRPIGLGWGFGLLVAAVGGCATNPAACNSGSSIIIKKLADLVAQARGKDLPDPAANNAPHTTLRRGREGKVDGYTTWDTPQNAGDPAPLRPAKKYHGSGSAHGGVPTPHVHEGGRVRPPHAWEIPA